MLPDWVLGITHGCRRRLCLGAPWHLEPAQRCLAAYNHLLRAHSTATACRALPVALGHPPTVMGVGCVQCGAAWCVQAAPVHSCVRAWLRCGWGMRQPATKAHLPPPSPSPCADVGSRVPRRARSHAAVVQPHTEAGTRSCEAAEGRAATQPPCTCRGGGTHDGAQPHTVAATPVRSAGPAAAQWLATRVCGMGGAAPVNCATPLWGLPGCPAPTHTASGYTGTGLNTATPLVACARSATQN